MVLEYLIKNEDRIVHLLDEGNLLRDNPDFNTMKTIEEVIELVDILVKRLNKGNEEINIEDIEKELAGSLIQIVFLIKTMKYINEDRINDFIADKLIQIERKNVKMKNNLVG